MTRTSSVSLLQSALHFQSISNILHQIQNLSTIYLASPALFRREDWTQEAVLRPRLQRLQSAVCSVYLVPAAECYRRFVFTDHIFASDHFQTVSCQLRAVRWGDVAASTVQDRLSPGRTSTSNQTQQQHSTITRPDTTILDLTLIPSFLCLPTSTHLQLSRPCNQPRVM